MNIAERADYIGTIVETIKESTQKYHAAQEERSARIVNAGYGGIGVSDSRESIKRRCMLAREELLKIMKELEEVY